VFEKPDSSKKEKVAAGVLRHFGYFTRKGTSHLSRYVPWVRKTQKALALPCDRSLFGGEKGTCSEWSEKFTGRYAGHDPLQCGSTKTESRIVGYSWYIREAAVTGKPFESTSHVRNDGSITYLLRGSVLKWPALLTARASTSGRFGDYPPQNTPPCMTNTNMQIRAIEPVGHGDS